MEKNSGLPDQVSFFRMNIKKSFFFSSKKNCPPCVILFYFILFFVVVILDGGIDFQFLRPCIICREHFNVRFVLDRI